VNILYRGPYIVYVLSIL